LHAKYKRRNDVINWTSTPPDATFADSWTEPGSRPHLARDEFIRLSITAARIWRAWTEGAEGIKKIFKTKQPVVIYRVGNRCVGSGACEYVEPGDTVLMFGRSLASLLEEDGGPAWAQS